MVFFPNALILLIGTVRCLGDELLRDQRQTHLVLGPDVLKESALPDPVPGINDPFWEKFLDEIGDLSEKLKDKSDYLKGLLKIRPMKEDDVKTSKEALKLLISDSKAKIKPILDLNMFELREDVPEDVKYNVKEFDKSIKLLEVTYG